MNLKKVIGLGLFGLGAAFAQEAAPAAQPAAAPETAAPVAAETPADSAKAPEAAAPETSTAAPVAAVEQSKDEPIAVPAAPVAQEQNAWFAEAAKNEQVASVAKDSVAPATKKSPFDVLHGSAYNSVGNAAAAYNVNDLLATPDQFAGRQFLYIEPSAERGVFSVGSIFGAVDISGNLGRGTIGYAVPGFGVAVRASLGQFYFSGDEGTKYNTEAGDDLGAVVSKVIGGFQLTANVDWFTYESEEGVEPAFGSSTDENFRNLSVSLGISNTPSAKGTSWSAGVSFLRHESTTENGGKVIDENADSYIQITPNFNFGALALKSERARFYAGVNAALPVVLFDGYERNMKGKKVDESMMELGLQLSPNVLGEVAIRENLLVFGEANLDWLAFSFGNGSDENGNEFSVLQSQMNKSTATIGLRYQYEDFVACEFALGDTFFSDTKSIFNGKGVFVSFGGFILF